VLLASLIASSAQANDPIGKTQKATGSTTAHRLGLIYSQRKNDPVFWRDELKTGAVSRLEVRFKDDTMLYLGDHSILSIDELVYDPNKQDKALFTLSQGVFRMVSGAINKAKGGSLTVRTPLATIGVRGTDFWGHQSENELTMALLDDGELEIQSRGQTFILTKPRDAISIVRGQPIGNVFTLTPDQIAQALKTIE